MENFTPYLHEKEALEHNAKFHKLQESSVYILLIFVSDIRPIKCVHGKDGHQTEKID